MVFNMHSVNQRYVVIGNSGSGKSYVSNFISKSLNIPLISLDDIFWSDSSYTTKRPETDVKNRLFAKAESEQWVIEGVYGELVHLITDSAETLVWLDLPWDECKANILRRESQNPRNSANFSDLLLYAEKYYSRDNPRSYSAHKVIFDGFAKRKCHLNSTKKVNEFIRNFV